MNGESGADRNANSATRGNRGHRNRNRPSFASRKSEVEGRSGVMITRLCTALRTAPEPVSVVAGHGSIELSTCGQFKLPARKYVAIHSSGNRD